MGQGTNTGHPGLPRGQMLATAAVSTTTLNFPEQEACEVKAINHT